MTKLATCLPQRAVVGVVEYFHQNFGVLDAIRRGLRYGVEHADADLLAVGHRGGGETARVGRVTRASFCFDTPTAGGGRLVDQLPQSVKAVHGGCPVPPAHERQAHTRFAVKHGIAGPAL